MIADWRSIMTGATHRWRWLIVGVAIFVAGAAVLSVRQGMTEARLVRADPDAIPADASLMRFGRDHGRPVFERDCAACHGPNGRGDPTRGIPDLADSDWLYGSGAVSEIEKTVSFGIRSHNPKAWNLAVMPAYARALPSATEPKIPPLTPDGISDVTAFLMKAGGKPADDEAAKRGAAIFGNSGGCYDCHGADGSGDSAIGAPNLIDSIWLYGDGGRQSIMESIARGHEGICPAWLGRISAAQIREVSVYVYSLSRDAGRPNDTRQAAR
jgi:cytochrome c oxidase cbb3-type subunit 3